MIGHKLSNKTKSATVAKSKLFRQLNKPVGIYEKKKLEEWRTYGVACYNVLYVFSTYVTGCRAVSQGMILI
jgi:hypothetical protein